MPTHRFPPSLALAALVLVSSAIVAAKPNDVLSSRRQSDLVVAAATSAPRTSRSEPRRPSGGSGRQTTTTRTSTTGSQFSPSQSWRGNHAQMCHVINCGARPTPTRDVPATHTSPRGNTSAGGQRQAASSGPRPPRSYVPAPSRPYVAPQPSARDYFEAGKAAIARGDYDGAIARFQAADRLARWPAYKQWIAYAWAKKAADAYNFGNSALAIKCYAEAYAAFNRAVYLEELAMAYNLAGVQAYQQRNNNAALVFFQNAASYDKNVGLYARNHRLAQAGVHNDEGIALYKAGNYRAALDKFSAANIENAAEPVYAQNVQAASGAIQNKYGQDQGAAGHYDEAIKAYNLAARYDPARKDIYDRNAHVIVAIVTNNRGIAQWNQGDFRGALTSFEQAAVENPADKTYRANAELARQKMRNGGNGVGAAITDAVQKARQANLDGVAAEKRGDNLAALRYFEQAVTYGGPDVGLNRDNVRLLKAKVLNGRGMAAYGKGDYLSEVRYYKQAISYGGPDVGTYRTNLAGAETRLAAATVKTSELIQSVATARGSDPTQWSISPKIPRSFSAESMRAPMSPGQLRQWLNNKLYTQMHYLQALGYQFYSNSIVCIMTKGGNCPSEDDVRDVMDLAAEIADTRRQLRLLPPANTATAEKTYIRDVKTVHVPPPPAGGYVVVGSVATVNGQPPPQTSNPRLQIRTLQNCNPIWESFPGVVVEPKLVGYDGGTPRYVWQYVARSSIRGTYPANCYPK